MTYSKLTKDLTGQRFGRLTVIARAPSDKNGNARWHCRCDCGGETTSLTWTLRNGESKSCGCYDREVKTARLTTHGKSKSPEYLPWAMMIQRCTNPKNTKYHLYGGRGITVCARWLASFEAFYEDVGARPTGSHTLDRIDTNGNYEPGNVRWATKYRQNNNKREQHWVTFRGERMSLTEAADLAGINPSTVFSRIYNLGWATEAALNTPAGKPNRTFPVPKRKRPKPD